MVGTNLLSTPCTPNWCPGCGDFGIWSALKRAVTNLGWKPSDFVMVYGVGCHGHMINFLKSYAFETLHGRPIPVAQGIKLGNNKLNVIVVAGDGDTFGEGTNHLVHAARRNIDITMILHDNQVYGLTTGQTAPTAQKGFKSKSTPFGVLEEPVNPLGIAIAAGATFIARGFAGDMAFTQSLIEQAIAHKGFSFVDVFQPCVTFNKVNTYQWFGDHTYYLPKSYQANDKAEAYKKALEWADKVPLGILYKEEKPTYEDGIPQIAEKPIIETPLPDKKTMDAFINEFI